MTRKAHILVVDDEQDVLQMIRSTLELEGYSVDLAIDGKSALALLMEHRPDLVLLDIKMPGLDGYQVLHLIRQRSDVPVIMVTAVLEDTSVQQSVGLGADDYLRKPFAAQVLLARIRAKLRRTLPGTSFYSSLTLST